MQFNSFLIEKCELYTRTTNNKLTQRNFYKYKEDLVRYKLL